MNPLYSTTLKGTIGELLVQLRLLEFGVQAMPPRKDSGNDLIAIRNRVVKSIQVKTTGKRIRRQFPNRNKIYDILALVRLAIDNSSYKLDETDIFLLKREELETNSVNWKNLAAYRLSQERIGIIWGTVATSTNVAQT